MLRDNTPFEDHTIQHGLWVKREDLSCDGPCFSKTRGVYAHIKARPEQVIGVLDTAHSQGGWAVARACSELGRECHLWYPWYKGQEIIPSQQRQAFGLGARLHRLPAGRSAVLYHAAKRQLALQAVNPASFYMMPNALKLPEMVTETANEVQSTFFNQLRHVPATVLVSCSSGTIAAGVALGLARLDWKGTLILHMGYARSDVQMLTYMMRMASGGDKVTTFGQKWELVNENYAYKDVARAGPSPPWPCSPFYDLKAYRWWRAKGRAQYGQALLWNIG